MQSVPTLRAALMILGAVVVIPIIAMAVYIHRLAGRTLGERRYPPTGVRTIDNARVYYEEAAIRRGRILQWTARLLIAASVGFVVLFWRLLLTLPTR